MKLERSTFSTDRALDFFSRKELVAQTGHSENDWPLVVIKELFDNALDACEEHGVAPEIRLTVDQHGITVEDNGPGIPPATIKGVVDFDVRVSSREAYVAPDRGAQGNALKTLIAMPYVLGGQDEGISISSCGKRNEITCRVDRVQQRPIVTHDVTPSDVKNGTSIHAPWPDSACSIEAAKERILQIATDFTVLNPHLTLTIDCFGEHRRIAATDTAWQKWRPSDPTSPHWYQPEHLARLAAGYAHDRPEMTVRELVSEFAGLSASAKQKVILEETGLSRTSLADLVNGNGDVARLLDKMQTYSNPVKPAALGVIGKERFAHKLLACGGIAESFQYRKADGVLNGVPWILEAAFVALEDREAPRRLVTGVNWSPGIVDPFRQVGGYGLDSELQSLRVGDDDEPVAVVVHFVTARAEYSDRGKSAVVVDGEIPIIETVTQVTKKWTKIRKAEERESSRALRRYERLLRTQEVSIKEAAWDVMAKAYGLASDNGTLPALARQIMYAARGEIQDRTGKTLNSQYFTQTLLPDYLQEHPDETAGWDVVFDARGHLIEPHTEFSVPLGTVDVREYLQGIEGHNVEPLEVSLNGGYPTHGPKHRYGAILFIEKEGFFPLFEKVKLAERYDVALMSTKGLTVTAARLLVDRLCEDVPLLVLHDFDKAGFSIIGTLQRATRRYEFQNAPKVVDIGLRLEDVIENDLQAESVGYPSDPSVNLRENGATEEEIDFLRTQRVELNAFTSRAFVNWIEKKLDQHHVKKIVPSRDVLEDAYRRALATKLINERAEEIVAEALEEAGKKTPKSLAREIRRRLDAEPELSWDAALAQIVEAE